ncbi:MAG: gliding motility-associated protein GldE [Fluviicola sp.]|nr:gliding motility-associated protein GldE [Fluviicola sp.]
MNTLEPSSTEPLARAFEYNHLVLILLLIILLLITAMMSAAESAFFSLKPLEKDTLKKDDSKSALIAKKLIDTPKHLLATILITNNFANIAIVIISSALLDVLIPSAGKENETLKFLIDVFVITFIILLIGEVIPKIYATKNALKTVKFTALPLSVMNIVPPFSWIRMGLVSGSKFIHRYAKKKGVKISSDELEHAIALTKEDNASYDDHKILEGIVKFGNTDVKQIMCQRLNVAAIDIESNFKEVVDEILECGYSRIPVYKESLDNVVGILFIKDLLQHLNNQDSFNWQALLRKPFFVPENKKIDDLLKEFQSKKVHMAIVVDEYGGASGIVTLEDVLEEIVGDITDEFDEEEIDFKKIDENTYIFEGRTALIDFYKILEIDGKEFENLKGESDSLGGFMIENAGRILKNKETITCNDIKLIVETSDKRRIKTIKVILPKIKDDL